MPPHSLPIAVHKCKSRNSAYAYPVEMLCTVRDNAPADSPGGKSAMCCARYPGLHTSITTRIRTRLHGTAAFTLTHKRRRSMRICTFVVPPRQTIGIDWFGKDAAKGLQRRRARSGRRATRAAAFKKIIPRRRQARKYAVVKIRSKEATTIHTRRTKFAFCRHCRENIV